MCAHDFFSFTRKEKIIQKSEYTWVVVERHTNTRAHWHGERAFRVFHIDEMKKKKCWESENFSFSHVWVSVCAEEKFPPFLKNFVLSSALIFLSLVVTRHVITWHEQESLRLIFKIFIHRTLITTAIRVLWLIRYFKVNEANDAHLLNLSKSI